MAALALLSSQVNEILGNLVWAGWLLRFPSCNPMLYEKDVQICVTQVPIDGFIQDGNTEHTVYAGSPAWGVHG